MHSHVLQHMLHWVLIYYNHMIFPNYPSEASGKCALLYFHLLTLKFHPIVLLHPALCPRKLGSEDHWHGSLFPWLLVWVGDWQELADLRVGREWDHGTYSLTQSLTGCHHISQLLKGGWLHSYCLLGSGYHFFPLSFRPTGQKWLFSAANWGSGTLPYWFPKPRPHHFKQLLTNSHK